MTRFFSKRRLAPRLLFCAVSICAMNLFFCDKKARNDAPEREVSDSTKALSETSATGMLTKETDQKEPDSLLYEEGIDFPKLLDGPPVSGARVRLLWAEEFGLDQEPGFHCGRWLLLRDKKELFANFYMVDVYSGDAAETVFKSYPVPVPDSDIRFFIDSKHARIGILDPRTGIHFIDLPAGYGYYENSTRTIPGTRNGFIAGMRNDHGILVLFDCDRKRIIKTRRIPRCHVVMHGHIVSLVFDSSVVFLGAATLDSLNGLSYKPDRILAESTYVVTAVSDSIRAYNVATMEKLWHRVTDFELLHAVSKLVLIREKGGTVGMAFDIVSGKAVWTADTAAMCYTEPERIGDFLFMEYDGNFSLARYSTGRYIGEFERLNTQRLDMLYISLSTDVDEETAEAVGLADIRNKALRYKIPHSRLVEPIYALPPAGGKNAVVVFKSRFSYNIYFGVEICDNTSSGGSDSISDGFLGLITSGDGIVYDGIAGPYRCPGIDTTIYSEILTPGTRTVVKTREELESAVAGAPENATIVVDGELSLSGALVLRNKHGLRITGLNRNCGISVDDDMADVITIDSCRSIGIDSLRLYHKTSGICDAAVVSVSNCEKITIGNCDISGSGVVGIDARQCADIRILRTTIHDCSEHGIRLDSVNGLIKFNRFENNGGNEVREDQITMDKSCKEMILFDGNSFPAVTSGE